VNSISNGLSRCEEVASTYLDPLNVQIVHRTDLDSNEDRQIDNDEEESDNDVHGDTQAQYSGN
jgi:hypothetical protein